MKPVLGILLLGLMLAIPAGADDIFFETDAAFNASQAERNKGVEAFHAGDLKSALVHMEEALRYRPNHPLLLGYVAYLAAETGDTDLARNSAGRYALMGLAPSSDIRTILEVKLGAGWAARTGKAFTDNLAPKGHAETKFLLPTDIRLVEGIAADPDGTFFFGTVASGHIYRMDATGPTQIVDARDHEFGSFFGMMIHEGSLYATFAHIEQTPGFIKGQGQTGVAKINPRTGNIERVWTLPGGTDGQQVADITATADGAIFVTDAAGKKVYQITGDTLFPLFSHPGFMSPQGIAETASGHLIMADYGRGLWRLDRENGVATLLGTTPSVSLHGIDGLARFDGTLIAIQNGTNPHRLIAVTLSDDGKQVEGITVKAQALDRFDEPTLGVSAPDGFYFVAASQWPKFGDGGAVKDGETLAPTAIMKLGD